MINAHRERESEYENLSQLAQEKKNLEKIYTF